MQQVPEYVKSLEIADDLRSIALSGTVVGCRISEAVHPEEESDVVELRFGGK